jgi:hypothetical protein
MEGDPASVQDQSLKEELDSQVLGVQRPTTFLKSLFNVLAVHDLSADRDIGSPAAWRRLRLKEHKLAEGRGREEWGIAKTLLESIPKDSVSGGIWRSLRRCSTASPEYAKGFLKLRTCTVSRIETYATRRQRG